MHGATHHTLLTFDPYPGLWRDTGYSIHRLLWAFIQEWMVCSVVTCIIFKHYCTCTVVPCWWWCEPVHMPIMTSICCIVWLSFRWPCAWPTRFNFGIRRHCNPGHTCKSPLFCVGALSLIKVFRLLLVLGLTVKYLYTWTLATFECILTRSNILLLLLYVYSMHLL